MRITTLGWACALALLTLEVVASCSAAAQDATAGMGASGAPLKPISVPLPAPEQDPAARSARSIECAQKADAQGLQGKTRKHFLHECKRSV
jgi:psiF repeat